MTEQKKSWINNPWTISIGTAIISISLTIVYDLIKSKPILFSITQLISWVAKNVMQFLLFEITVYWIIIFIILAILVLYIIAKFNTPEKSLPDFTNYKSETFKKFRWSWKWKYNNSQKAWNAVDLTVHCPKCDTTMISSYSAMHGGNFFECPRCNFIATGNDFELKDRIETLILDDIRKGKK